MAHLPHILSETTSRPANYLFYDRTADAVEKETAAVAHHYDNAAMESFFATLKQELVYQRNYENRKQTKQDIFDGAARRYIEVWYNRMRRHFSLGYVSPTDYENTNFYTEAA